MRESRLFRALQSITLWSSSGSFLKRAASLLAQAGDDGAPPILDEEQIRKLRDLLVRARRAKVVNTIAFWMTLAGAIGLALSTLIEGIGALAMLGLRLVLVIATYWFGKMHIEHKGQQNLYENGARSIVYDLSRSVHEPGGKDSDKRGLVREAIGRGRRWLGDLMQAIAEGRAEIHVF
ncbi:MAG: hypothetical protein GWN87_07515, partial [Desulfuromonadales bacterium]|nr:hypothetical protein [Desulfuromonadales bacterium]